MIVYSCNNNIINNSFTYLSNLQMFIFEKNNFLQLQLKQKVISDRQTHLSKLIRINVNP